MTSVLNADDLCSNTVRGSPAVKSKTLMRVNEDGRVVVPASFGKALGISIGDEVILQIVDDEWHITTLRRRFAARPKPGPQAREAKYLSGRRIDRRAA